MATATANILFTDVEESTELRARLGETAADRVFVDHERLLTRLVEHQHGRVVKTAGDGVMAAFDSASDAVQAAIHVQQAVARRPEGLRIRIGIAAGDVSWENNDCFGLPVVTAARLETAAKGGQILVSQVVRLLAGDRSEASFEALGPLELKGMPEPVEAYAVVWQSQDEDVEAERVPLPPALTASPAFSFVGREAEWNTLASAWELVAAGGRGVVLLGGEAGAGKTRLAFEFARQVYDEGAAVLFGGCDAQLAIPYQPWVQALDHLLRTLPPSELDDDVAADLGVLAPFIPKIDRPSNVPSPSILDADAERYRLFAAVDAVLAEAGNRWPLMVVLDDLHWGAAQTLSLLAHLARQGTAARVLVVGTFRDTGDELTEPLAAALADMRRLDSVVRVRVSGLADDDVASFVAQATGQDLDDSLSRLAADITVRSRGNPFFVGELWHHLVSSRAVVNEEGRWVVRTSLADAGVPDSVREVVGDRLAHVSFASRRLAEVAALAGQAELRVLLSAADATASDVTASLDELSAAGLLEAVDRPHLSYRFTHALVRESIEAAIPPASRAQVHMRIGDALESLHEADRRPVLAELFRHYTEAAPLGMASKAVYYGRRAAEQAMASLAYEDAASYLTTALELTASGSRTRTEVMIALGDAVAFRGDWVQAQGIFEEAFHLAREHGEATLVAEAALGFEDSTHGPGLSGDDALRMVSEAIRLVGDEGSLLRAKLEAAHARSLTHSGRLEEAKAKLESALAMGREAGDEALTLALIAALVSETDPPQLIRHADELDEVAVRTGNLWTVAYAGVFRLRAYLMLGDLDRARALVVRHRALAARIHHEVVDLESLHYELTLALAVGDFETAEASAEEALRLGADRWPAAAGMYGLQMFAIRREQGRLAEVLPVLEAIAGREGSGGVWLPGLAVLYAEVGRIDDARRELDTLAADGFASIPRDSLWPACVAFLAEVCIAVDDPTRADTLYAELLGFEGLNLMVGHTICFGPADRLLGGLAALAGRRIDAERHFRVAIDLAMSGGAAVWQAHVQHDWARAKIATGDLEGARPLFAEALATAVELGMNSLADRCRPLTGARLTAVPPPPALPDGLSSREVDVLRLVAAGCSNREIGERLLISPNTAANHVRAILQKTACANRAEAAAYAARHDLLD